MHVKKPAIKTPAGVVIAGQPGTKHKDIGATGKRGFVLSDGSFAGRTEAGKVAKKAGQVKKMPTPKLHTSNLKKGY
jgi:hypothetical protein